MDGDRLTEGILLHRTMRPEKQTKAYSFQYLILGFLSSPYFLCSSQCQVDVRLVLYIQVRYKQGGRYRALLSLTLNPMVERNR